MTKKQEYLMLAHVLDTKKHRIGGWWLSEKLDGTRAFWDGGISRGLPVSDIPYANKVKDGRYVDTPIATGLWSRSGKAIQAPGWWLDKLPRILLDGELWIGYGKFQELRTIVSRLDSPDWQDVKYMVFDSPTPEEVFANRDVKIRNEYTFHVSRPKEGFSLDKAVKPEWTFELRNVFLKNQEQNEVFNVVKQYHLSLDKEHAIGDMVEIMDMVLLRGGEGVVLRNGSSKWVPERSWNLLKHKPVNTADGTVIGYTAGEEGKTGQLLGKIGALILKLENGKTLKLSGLTHGQREITDPVVRNEAMMWPGEIIDVFTDYNHHLFPKGTIIEFKYRELSDDGIPKEARFLRIKGEE
jgi:DNA ligase-1